MTVENLYALNCAELDWKKNPSSLQGLKWSTIITPKASKAKKQQGSDQWFNRNGKKWDRKKGNCLYCVKYSHFKRDLRQRVQGENRQRDNQPNNATSSNNLNGQIRGIILASKTELIVTIRRIKEEICKLTMKSEPGWTKLLSVLCDNFSSSNAGSHCTSFNYSFGGLIAIIKFRSNFAERP